MKELVKRNCRQESTDEYDAPLAKANEQGDYQEIFITAPDVYSQADAMIDLLYYLLGTCVEMGVKPDPLFQIVHESNMKKLASGSSVIKDSEGKAQKPPPGYIHLL